MKYNFLKIIRAVAVVLILGTAVFIFTACGADSDETLNKTVRSRLSDVDSYESRVRLSAALSSDDRFMTAACDLTVESSFDPFTVHGTGTITAESGNMEAELPVEMYCTVDNGEQKLYLGYGGRYTALSYTASDGQPSPSGFLRALFENDCFDIRSDNISDDDANAPTVVHCLTDGQLAASCFGLRAVSFLSLTADQAGIRPLRIPITLSLDRETLLPDSVTAYADGTFRSPSYSYSVNVLSINTVYVSYNSSEAVKIPDSFKSIPSDTDADSIASDIINVLETSLDGEVPKLRRAVQRSALGSLWYDYTMNVNGKIITLPCNYDDIASTGLYLDTEDTAANAVLSGYDTRSAFFQNTNGSSVMVNFYNPYSTPREINKCLVTEISGDTWAEESGIQIEVPGGITIGSTIDEVTAAYGQPDMTKEDDNYFVMTWARGGSYYRCIEISFGRATGAVEMIDLCRSE